MVVLTQTTTGRYHPRLQPDEAKVTNPVAYQTPTIIFLAPHLMSK